MLEHNEEWPLFSQLEEGHLAMLYYLLSPKIIAKKMPILMQCAMKPAYISSPPHSRNY